MPSMDLQYFILNSSISGILQVSFSKTFLQYNSMLNHLIIKQEILTFQLRTNLWKKFWRY